MGQESYIHNLARSMMGPVGVWNKLHLYGIPGCAQVIYENHHTAIKDLLSYMKPQTLGRIAATGLAWNTESGKCSLYDVHCGTYLSKKASGKDLLLEIACTAIVAAMTDICRHANRAPRLTSPGPNCHSK